MAVDSAGSTISPPISASTVASSNITTQTKTTNTNTNTNTNTINNKNGNETNNENESESVDNDLNEDNVAYDEDNLPIPQGIVSLDETNLDENESPNLNLLNADNPVWLVRLTPQLSELWKNDDFLHGQLLGNIKIPKNPNNNISSNSTTPNNNTINNSKILLELNNEIPQHKNLDNQYELKLIKQVVDNEYAFSESQFKQFRNRLMYRTKVVDMPNQPKMKFVNKEVLSHEAKWTRKVKNYKKEAQIRELRAKDPEYKAKMNESGMGTTFVYEPDQQNSNNSTGGNNFNHRFGRNNNVPFKKFIPYAKTIPKKTEIVGKIVHEGFIIPTKLAANNKLRIMEQRKRLNQMTKRRTINYIKSEKVGIMHGRATPNIQTGSTVTLSKELAAKKEAAKQEGRAARMERDVLMNILFKLFNEYEYWTFKGLREKTNQPEVYLKECLENVAVMERKGPYALKWRLKDEYRKSIAAENKIAIGDDDDDNDNPDDNAQNEDEDMDEVEMEDIAAL